MWTSAAFLYKSLQVAIVIFLRFQQNPGRCRLILKLILENNFCSRFPNFCNSPSQNIKMITRMERASLRSVVNVKPGMFGRRRRRSMPPSVVEMKRGLSRSDG